jgi:hypothetical protein
MKISILVCREWKRLNVIFLNIETFLYLENILKKIIDTLILTTYQATIVRKDTGLSWYLFDGSKIFQGYKCLYRAQTRPVRLRAELFGWSAASAITTTKSSYINDGLMEELTNIACSDEESRFIYKTVSTIIESD